MSGVPEFAFAMVLFLTTHVVPMAPAIRGRLVAALGRKVYLLAYGALSVAMLAWLISATLRLPYVQLWHPAPWTTYVPAVLMPVACILLVMGLAASNPLSVGIRQSRGECRPGGVLLVTRHPVLWAFALWAGAHIPPNGDLARATLFGLLLAFALAGMPVSDMRARRQLGINAWHRLSESTSVIPFAALLSGRVRIAMSRGDCGWMIAGIALWLALLALHQPIIGVSPVPR